MNDPTGSTVLNERSGLASEWAFLGAGALLFIASAAGLVYWAAGMQGSSSSSMIWMGMPGQTWLGAAAAFMGMWMVMMLAMMLPSLVPSLLSYRRALRRQSAPGLSGLTMLAGLGYFAVWAIVGLIAYPLGVLIATAEMQWMALDNLAFPLTVLVLVLAGILQFSRWKLRMLSDYCQAPAGESQQSLRPYSAWQFGLRLGMHCVTSCIGFIIVLLAIGVMNLGGMALIAAAITLERLAPKPGLTARLLGAAVVLIGVLMIVSRIRPFI